MNFIDEKAKRVKYLRALEKFAKFATSSLKRDDFDEEAFRARVAKNAEIISKVESVYLDQPYTKALEEFINLLITNAKKDELLKSANALDKLRKSKTYKKDKHKNKFKDED
ncbi:hypothetical protein CCAL9344_00260 [Campylobacter sp. RM9344]|uniref:Uncharacterized protein n=1 Tax=Campylobacter californiensis TaxID=1032243 RepID=A0AAW3ZRZ1_9BACT|nr:MULTISPECIES: hypothetical protein [unclassified Campylobacter]MBE2983782.1 hypothetical protein [Campylobacter sp. RM6883]MBE2994320.1 hypothetical protein [Campylobacter sp. RM6913]MBE3028628.1 hypothetical protein [Campylobacter sp. RM9344]MBE3607517.1 hypothetical protein [Campylobacter sp. RM9337]QCD50911.1 hypothetical protein CCAL_1009 [Campylobacter sp. RM6914]